MNLNVRLFGNVFRRFITDYTLHYIAAIDRGMRFHKEMITKKKHRLLTSRRGGLFTVF